MESTQVAIQKQKNSQLSVALIIINVLLIVVFTNIGNISEDQSALNIAFIVWSATILVGGYAFSYHGKGYSIAKWIFGVLFLLSILCIIFYIYVTGLAQAFKN